MTKSQLKCIAGQYIIRLGFILLGFTHQQMRGNCSPSSIIIGLNDPRRVLSHTPFGERTTLPITEEDFPSFSLFMAFNTLADELGGTNATSLPSFATYSGSKPNSAQAALTSFFMGIELSSIIMPLSEEIAISFNVVARPPLVGSLRTLMSGDAASIFPTRPPSGAQSLMSFELNLKSFLAAITDIP